MKKTINILTLITFIFSININAENKLITIYDNDCGFCHSLLNKTYQNEFVKEQLRNYEHQLFEANSIKGKEFIKNYNIKSYPTQIAIINGKEIVLNGFLNPKYQLEFLNNPKLFKELLETNQSGTTRFQQNDFLEEKFIRFLCTTINLANRSRQDPYEEFMKVLKILIDKLGLKIKNPTKFAFENLDKLVCENNDTSKIRKTSTILKYAIDTGNYDFIRGPLFIKVNGKKVCNPYIDWNRKDIIDGEEETLIQFIDKMLNYGGFADFHDFGTIRNIRMRVSACAEDHAIKEAYNKNLTEDKISEIRLKYDPYFFEGLAETFKYLKTGVKKFGYMNKLGKIVIPLIYENTNTFRKGKAYVTLNDKEFYINKKGECLENCD
jgi:hypothetical protein